MSVQMSAIEALLKLAPFGPLEVAATCRQWVHTHQNEASTEIKEMIATCLENYKSAIESLANHPA